MTLGYVCRVVAEDGADARPGEPGELLVGGIPGVSLMKEYRKDAEATKRTLVDGWLRTGDVVRADPDGYFYFIDRTQGHDQAERGECRGERGGVSHQAPSRRLRRCRRRHPRPPPRRGDRRLRRPPGGASVEADEILDWCSARLARFRVPSVMEFRAELPRTSVGKIQKHVLKADDLRESGSA